MADEYDAQLETYRTAIEIASNRPVLNRGYFCKWPFEQSYWDSLTYRSFTDSVLIECTLKRNARFDIVDFYINSEKWLCVRAIHPIQHLNQEELAFLMLTVASEADRLKQIMLGFDYH